MVRLQSALFALSGALAELECEPARRFNILEDALLVNTRQASTLIYQVYRSLGQELGLTLGRGYLEDTLQGQRQAGDDRRLRPGPKGPSRRYRDYSRAAKIGAAKRHRPE